MKMYTIEQASEILKVPQQRIYYEIHSGRLKPLNIMGRYALSEENIESLKNKYFRKDNLITVDEYCKSKKISRSIFNYRKGIGYIKVIKIDGRVYVRSDK